MAVPKVVGVETEYGIAATGAREFNPVIASSLVIAGFAGESSCLATAIDGFHRGQDVTFLSDASASHGLEDIAAHEIHRTVSAIMRVFGDVTDTQSWIATSSPFKPMLAASRPTHSND